MEHRFNGNSKSKYRDSQKNYLSHLKIYLLLWYKNNQDKESALIKAYRHTPQSLKILKNNPKLPACLFRLHKLDKGLVSLFASIFLCSFEHKNYLCTRKEVSIDQYHQQPKYMNKSRK